MTDSITHLDKLISFNTVSRESNLALIDHVAASLSVHKRPREVRIVDTLPRNAMGKVQKQQLKR